MSHLKNLQSTQGSGSTDEPVIGGTIELSNNVIDKMEITQFRYFDHEQKNGRK